MHRIVLLTTVGMSLITAQAWAVGASPAVGRWNIRIGKGEPRAFCWMEILADGDKYKARFQPEAGGVHDIDPPKIDGDEVEFKAGWTYAATVKGDEMIGVRTEGNRKEDFVAKRWVPMLSLKGTWTLAVEGLDDSPVLTFRDTRRGTLGGQLRMKDGKGGRVGDLATEGCTISFTARAQGASEGTAVKAVVKGDVMQGELTTADGKRHKFTAKRERTWGEPIELFNGKNLDGWKPLGGGPDDFKWQVKDGILWTPGGANIVSEKKFGDFKIHVEFRVPPRGNSGVYLRGRYEIQVADSHDEKEIGPHSCASIYCRLVPPKNASKPAGEWQTYDATLIGQYVTLFFNGEKIYDNEEIAGMTGGAIDNYDDRPGPIYLQGDHGKIEYRKITVTPAAE